jgi:hypothetical protein
MDLIPLIYMKNRKIHAEKTRSSVSLEEFLKQVDEEMKIYILDLDGIEKDKPNLCTYQRLSGAHDLWVDNGPRNLGDIVDATMAGATDITLRKNLCPNLYVSDIREIYENKIYANIDFAEDLSFYDADGLVNFNSREEIASNFKYSDLFKRTILKNKIYSYESDLKNRSYWECCGVEGLLVDVNKLKEFKNGF